MTQSNALHVTLVFERDIPAAVEQVFAAFADADKRIEWSAPSDNTALIYDEANFHEGGQDRFRCGPIADPNIHGTTRYLDIIPNHRIVSSETIAMGGKPLCVSLSTLELTREGDKTKLKTTIQLVSFVGEEMVKGHKSGNNASLDNLVRYLSQMNADRP
jgi:uncharacterized protein YndB with AHSA1/START domain